MGVLTGVLFVAASMATGGVVRQLLVALGRNARYAADVGGLAATVMFLLLAVFAAVRYVFG